jgi:hypothetical protein
MTSVGKLRGALLAWLTDQATPVPVAVYRTLFVSERTDISVRQHPAILLGPCALAFAGLIAASLTSAMARSGIVILSAWIIWVALLAYLALKVTDWLGSFFVVTYTRIILVTGSVRKTVDFIPLDMLDDITFQQSALGRFWGYGSFTVTSRAPNQIIQKIEYVSDPDRLYAKLANAAYMPRKIECPECLGNGTTWARPGQEPPQVLRDEDWDVDTAPVSGRGFSELFEATGLVKVKCSACDGQGVVSRDIR